MIAKKKANLRQFHMSEQGLVLESTISSEQQSAPTKPNVTLQPGNFSSALRLSKTSVKDSLHIT